MSLNAPGAAKLCRGLCVQMIKFPLFEPLLVWALATKLVPMPQSVHPSGLADVFILTLPCRLCWLVLLLVVAAVAARVHFLRM